MSTLLLMIFLSYLVGSIPTSIIAGRLIKGIDIREHGSGNAGATNVFRVLGWRAGLLVLVIDMMKGLVPTVWFAQWGAADLGWDYINVQLLAGISAILGHIWTVFAGFKGGKGVGTGAGMVLGLAPAAVAVCLVIFIIVVGISRYVSLGSIISSLALPLILVAARVFELQEVPFQVLLISVFIPALILYTHRANIRRLRRGEESKIELQRKRSAT